MTTTSPSISPEKQSLVDEVTSALFPNALPPLPLTNSLDSWEPSLFINTSTGTFSNMSLDDMSKTCTVKAVIEEMISSGPMWMSSQASCGIPKSLYDIDYASDQESDTMIGCMYSPCSEAISKGTAVYISSDGQATASYQPKLSVKDHLQALTLSPQLSYMPYLP